MYTTIPRQEVVEHRPRPGDPALEIIDHREQPTQNRTKKKRPEQLPYDSLKAQRDTLFKQELVYKKRIEELEKGSRELLKNYESTYDENVKLKRILDNGPDAVKMKQMSKEKREQKGLIDQLKDENKSLVEKLSGLEKEVHAERLKAHERGWDVQLAKVKKKREEEESIPTEGPFVAGHIAKPKRMMLHDEDGDKQVDAYDLEVDSLEKETQVLLNKVKILKREKEQIDYATLMGKGAVTKNKTVAKAINDKLNKDLNKFVMRLQMLKMKQNAARTFFTVVTDESNPIIQVKQTELTGGKNSPNRSDIGDMSGRSWKRQSGGSQKSSRGDQGKPSVTNSPINILEVGPNAYHTSKLNNTKGKVSAQNSKPSSLKSGNSSRKQSVAESETSLPANGKRKVEMQRRSENMTPKDNDAPTDRTSAGIWRKVQSNKLSGKMRAEARVKSETSKVDESQKKQEKPLQQNSKPVVNGTLSKKTAVSSTTKEDGVIQTSKNKGKDTESTGRYTHGPEPVGFKNITKKTTTNNTVETMPFSTNTNRFQAKSKESKQFAFGQTENKDPAHHHDHGKLYRINGIDDGYSMIKLHNHVKELDKTDNANPIPIHFKTRRSLDIREGRSIIGNSGIRQDGFYRRINDNDPYFGL